MKYDYVKTLLYLYPKLSQIEEALDMGVENAAVYSYRAKGDTLALAEKIAEDIFVRKNLGAVKIALGEALSELSDEERKALSDKFFCRGKGTVKRNVPSRQYYRLRESALKKTWAGLSSRGWTESDYFGAFGNFQPFAHFYAAVKREEESAVRNKARRKEAHTRTAQKSERCSSRRVGGFLPLRTTTATTTAATHKRQMTAICNALNPSDSFVGSSAGGISPEAEER